MWVAVAPAPLQFWGLLSVLLPSAAYLVALGARHRDAADGSPAVRREFSDALRVLALGVPIVAYSFWAQRLGVPPLIGALNSGLLRRRDDVRRITTSAGSCLLGR